MNNLIISNFQAINVGDGKNVALSWAVSDLSQIKYFVVEVWDNAKKTWVPYDGFHGTIFPKTGESYPPRKVVYTSPRAGNILFRVKAVSHQGESSEWSNIACDIEVEGAQYAETSAYFIKRGFSVTHVFGYNLNVESGVAYLGGSRVFIPDDVPLRLPNQNNVQYVIYITKNGIINYVQGDKTPTDSIRLADVFVDVAGGITIVDKRFLWAPDGLQVTYDPNFGRFCYFIHWEPYNELNLKSWRIYRAEGFSEPDPEDFKAISIVEKDTDIYEDAYNLKRGVRYWYKISAIDWGENESKPSTAFSLDIDEDDFQRPSVPTGLTAEAFGSTNIVNIGLSWNANPEDNVAGYYLWYRPEGQLDFILLSLVTGKNVTSYTHSFVQKGLRYWYCISAYNTYGVQSERSSPISCIAGDTMPPAAPTWGFSPLRTGASDDGPYSCWIDVEWNEVSTNQDGTPIDDLLAYYIYTLDSNEHGDVIQRFVDYVYAGNNTYRLNGLTRGAKYTFVITAIDKWGNESYPSEERSIIAGGPVPKAPELLSVQKLDNNKVEITFTAVTENTEESGGGPAAILEYAVYRALNAPIGFLEIGRVKAQDPQPEEYSYIDSTVVRGDQYFYCVKAVSISFNYSDYSNYMSIKAGDYEAPSPPEWVSLETRINEDYTIDNILTFNCGQESDLWGVYVYARRATTTENWSLIGTVPNQGENPYVFIHHGVTNKEIYQYRLEAYDLTGNVSFSSEVRTITSGNLYPPKAPVVTEEGFYDYELNQACVSLSWPEVTENDNPDEYEPVVGLAGYRIYRSYFRDYNYKLIATVPNNELNEFIDQEVVNGITYYYRVTTYNVFDQESDYCQVEVVAGDVTPPLVPEVTLVPIFNPSTPTLVTVELHITSEDEPAYYKIYRSINGIQWFLDETVERNPEGETIYSYEMTYGNTAYCRVSAVSIPGVEGPYYELEQQVLDTDPPADISAPSIVFEQTDDGNFTAVISWSYNPPEDFERYEVLYDQDNPAVIATIFDKDVKIYRVTGLKPGQTYSFAVVCADVYKLRSDPDWATATPADTTIPNAPANVTATGGIFLILVEWDPVTKNTDGTDCNDLGYYVIEASKDEEFTNAVVFTVPSTSTSYTFNTSDTSATWYFRVRSKDWYNNNSAWTVSNGAKALSIDEELDDVPPEEAPNWTEDQPVPFTGIEWAKDNNGNSIEDEPRNVWIKFAWDPVVGADHYNVYLSRNGVSYYLVAKPKDTEYRIDGLLANTTYYVKITGCGRLGSEGPESEPKQITTSKVVRVIPPIDEMIVTEGKGMIAIRWNPCSIKDVEYVLQYRATLNPPGGVRTWEPEWTEIYRGKTTSFVHSSLEYEKYYQYRIYCLDLSGNISDYGPIDYDQFDWTPDKIGSEDLAANSVYARHIYTDQINATHISSFSIEARHLTSDSVTAGKIAAGAVTTRELSVSLGGYNSILNSAFGMTDLNENFGVNWQINSVCEECESSNLYFNKYGEVVCAECGEIQDGFEIAEVPNLPINSEYCLYIDREAPFVPNREIIQDLDITHMSGEKSILSFYFKSDAIMGEECRVELFIRYRDGLEEKTLTIGTTIKGTTDWIRREIPFDMPNSVISAQLRIYMKGYSVGALRLVGLQLETGDVVTAWNPNKNEVYGCSGLVQINTEGIKVLNGRVSIITDEGSVAITGTGILARKDDNNFALLNKHGLSVYSTGDEGALNIVSLNEGNSLEIRASGIVAKREDIETFNLDTATATLSVFGGYLKFTSNDDPSNPTYLEISSSGVLAKRNGVTTLRFDNTASKLSIFDGSFELRTAIEGMLQGIVFTKDGIKAYSPTKVTFELNAATGDVKIRNGVLILGEEDTSGARMILDSGGLRLYNEDSINDNTGLVFRLSRTSTDGRLLYLDGGQGGFKITSGEDSILFTEKELVGPSFTLDASGLVIDNGIIKNGDVLIDPHGINIFGGYGLRVYGANPEEYPDPNDILISTIDNKGITIRGQQGLKIVGNGEIVFEDPDQPDQFTTAISSTGINASGITAGVLKITGEAGDNNPRIEIYDGTHQRVNIDRNGIEIYNGSLNVYSGDGSTATIRDGFIVADGLRVGIGASNFVRNGRADFNTNYWNYIGTLTVEENIIERGLRAGKTGKYAFKLQTTNGGRLEQVKLSNDDYAEKKDNIYTFTAWVYIVEGEIQVEIVQDDTLLNGNDGSVPKNEIITRSGWNRVEIRFIPTKLIDGVTAPVTYRFNAVDKTIAYITDVCSVEGDYSATYTCHPTEISSASGSVQISDQGIAVKNGLFSLQSTEDGTNFEITGKGIYQYKAVGGDKEENYIFKLDTEAFGLKLQNSNVVINDEVGIKITNVSDSNKFVQLTTVGPLQGLVIRGGLIDISSGGDSGNRLSIKSNRIAVHSNNEEVIGIGFVQDNDGDPIYGMVIKEGAIDICSGKLDKPGLRIKGNQISVRGDNGQEVVQLGYVNMGSTNMYGLMIRDGKFALISGDTGGSVDITNKAVRVTHKEIDDQGNERTTYTELTHEGLIYNGIKKSEYVRNIQVSEAPVECAQRVYLEGFIRTPRILLVPASFTTYCATDPYSKASQGIRISVSEANRNYFVPEAVYVVDSVKMTTFNRSIPSPQLGDGHFYLDDDWEVWEVYTSSKRATQLTISLKVVAARHGSTGPSGGSFTMYEDLYYTVDFSYDNGVNWERVVDKCRKDYQKTETYSSNIVTPRRIRARIRASSVRPQPFGNPTIAGESYVQVTGAYYYADEHIPMGSSKANNMKPTFYYIAIE